MIRKASDITLKVLPVLGHAEHLYYYEGPCRMGSGDSLQPGFDALLAEQFKATVMENLRAIAPEGVEILEPYDIMRTDDWDNNEQQYLDAAKVVAEADVYVTNNVIAVDDVVEEFVQRYPKDVIISPTSNSSITVHAASLKLRVPEVTVCAPITWSDVKARFVALRAKKIINNTRILCVNRFGSPTSFSSIDTFRDTEEITKNLGVRFRYFNVHEFIDQMSPAVEGGNSTTPGRKTWDLTEEELAQVKAIAKDLADGANNVYMPLENIENSVKAFVLARKIMDARDCNAFTAPCPDACSTRRLHESRFTFCLTHSLNMEECIPSSCEYDANAVLSQQTLIAVSGKVPFVGNTSAIPYENGKIISRFAMGEEEIAKMYEAGAENLYYTQHSVPPRNLNDNNEKRAYDIRPFAMENQFGATIKYDFDQDAGKMITCCRFSPDGSKLFIGRGEIVCGGGFNKGNCSTSVIYRVNDQKDFFKKQCYAGNHVCLVYGDYTDQLIELCEVLGIEALVSR